MNNNLQAIEVAIGSASAARVFTGDDTQLKSRFMAAGKAIASESLRAVRSCPDEWFSSTIMSIGKVAMDEDDDVTMDRLRKTMDGLRSLNALLEGVPVDLERLSLGDDLLPVVDWFKELQTNLTDERNNGHNT